MNKKLKKRILLTLSAIFLVLGLCCLLYLAQFCRGGVVHNRLQEQAEAERAQMLELPVDFETLWQTNDEIYAWLEVPGTGISQPILQSADDDLFYNSHGVDRHYYSGGCVYTQRYNQKDFSDPMTVVYGHNLHDESIFAPLLQFMDQAFLEEHHKIWIYTPETVYEYEIFAACPHGIEHLLLCYDFEDEAGFRDFFASVEEPVKNGTYRPEAFPQAGDRVLTLATCFRLAFHYRYLVQGILVGTYDAVPPAP